MRSSEGPAGPAGPAAQAAFAKKAAHVKAAKATTSALAQELIEANQELAAKSLARGEHHDRSVRVAGAPPLLGAYLLSKPQVLAIANVTFPTIWAWMRAGKFPRARVVGGKTMWLSSEIEAWLAALPVRQLKGDEPKARDTWDHENLRNAAALRAKRKHQRDDEPSEVIPTSS